MRVTCGVISHEGYLCGVIPHEGYLCGVICHEGYLSGGLSVMRWSVLGWYGMNMVFNTVIKSDGHFC